MPKPLRRRLSVVVALVGALVVLGAVSAAADEVAPAVAGDCGVSQFCLWSGAFYSGTFTETTSTTAVAVGFSPARSVWNRSSHAAVVYSGPSGTGTATCFAPGAQAGSVSVVAGSMRVLTTTSC